MNGALGGAVVSDFDGTLTNLEVGWNSLRETLAVDHIEDLWRDRGMQRWAAVTEAEVEAARTASPVPFVMDALRSVPAVAVLTSNDEAAVETFLDRWPELGSKVRVVVGRRTLGGPKTDFEIFSSGYSRCRDAIASHDTGQISYLGDQTYELDFARTLGAATFGVLDLDPTRPGPGPGRD
jgi:phosphoglycolate phosphatase-like HAD superfamily hydrolase